MGFNMKSWSNPITLDSNNLNRIEQGIKNAHDTLEITNEEVSNLQNKQAQIVKDINTLTKDAPNILETLTKVTTLLNNNDISAILSSANTFLTKTPQLLSEEELKQVHKNLGLNSFLKLTSIKVNGVDAVSGSQVNITLPTIDTALNINSTNAISNKAVALAIQNSSLNKNIPVYLSDLLQDNNHMTVSRDEKVKWNSFWDLIRDINIEESDPTVPSWAKKPNKPVYLYSEIIDTPVKLSAFTNDMDFTTNTYVNSELTKLQNATNAYIDSEITNLQKALLGPDGDAALDTITELASAIADNSDIITVLNEAITNKADTSLLEDYVTKGTEQTVSGTKKFTANNNTFTRTLVLGANTPINFTGIGAGTYNIGAFVCNTTDKFGVECPRETDSSSAAIIPFRIGARGGQLGILQSGNIYQNGKQVANAEDVLPLSAGSEKALTGDLYIGDTNTTTRRIYIAKDTGITGSASGNLVLSSRQGQTIYFRPSGLSSDSGAILFSSGLFKPAASLGVSLGSSDYPFNNIYGGVIYQRNDKDKFVQVANKEDISEKLTGTKFSPNATFNTYIPYAEGNYHNSTPLYVATFINNNGANGLTYSTIAELKTQLQIHKLGTTNWSVTQDSSGNLVFTYN